VPTSKRPQINYAQYPRIPSKVLKGTSNEEVVDDAVAEVAMFGTIADEAIKYVNLERMECRDTQISYVDAESLAGPFEACRPKKGLKSIAPKHLEALGRAIRRAPHGEAFIST
jgi:hypothetical protein